VLVEQVFEDISGNLFMENPYAPQKDPRTEVVRFARDTHQDHTLGIYSSSEVGVKPEIVKPNSGLLRKIEENDFTIEDLHGEVLQFPTPCPNCGTECQTNMKLTSILYFLDSRLTDGGEVVNLTCRSHFTTGNVFWYSFLLDSGLCCGQKD
jgi:hypothetical protein